MVLFLLLIPNYSGQPETRLSTMSVNPLTRLSHVLFVILLGDLEEFLFRQRDLWYHNKIHKSSIFCQDISIILTFLTLGKFCIPVSIIHLISISAEVWDMLARKLILNTGENAFILKYSSPSSFIVYTPVLVQNLMLHIHMYTRSCNYFKVATVFSWNRLNFSSPLNCLNAIRRRSRRRLRGVPALSCKASTISGIFCWVFT